MRMHEQRCNDAKNAADTPLINHIAIPSSFPQPGAAEDRILGSMELGRKLKKPPQLVVVVADMSLERESVWKRERERWIN